MGRLTHRTVACTPLPLLCCTTHHNTYTHTANVDFCILHFAFCILQREYRFFQPCRVLRARRCTFSSFLFFFFFFFTKFNISLSSSSFFALLHNILPIYLYYMVHCRKFKVIYMLIEFVKNRSIKFSLRPFSF